MNIRENLDVIVEHHPHYESLNRKLVEDSLKIEFKQRYDNIGAEMTGLRTSSPSIILIKKWVEQLIHRKWDYDGSFYDVDISDTWFVRYGIGDQSFPHDHHMNLLSFVYFVKCPKGSSPLVFTTTGKRIKAEDGKVLVFPSTLFHHVPINKCDDRMVISGNIALVKE